jgi:iron complex outermembrane receptor protein
MALIRLEAPHPPPGFAMHLRDLLVGLLGFLALSAGAAGAQVTAPAARGAIQGRVVNASGSPEAGAAVAARAEGDTTVAARAATGADGRFRLDVAPGRYLVSARKEGSEAAVGPLAVAAGGVADAGELRLAGAVALEGVVARAERPPVIHAEDRTVYSVKDMPSVTGGAADVMRTVPELEVDLEGNVTMVGNRAVTLHINGRPSPLRGEALTQFIKNLPADRIDRIEVIPNPSVRFEGGNTAIVNVVLRKDVRLGLSGSLSANAASRGGNGLSSQLAYQAGKLTLFGGGSANRFEYGDRSREVRRNLLGASPTYLDQDRSTSGRHFSAGADLTAELDVSEKDVLWASGSVYSGGSGGDGWSHNLLLDADSAATRIFDRVNSSDGGYLFGQAALGFRRTVEPERHELSLEARFDRDGNDNDGRFEETTSMRVGEPEAAEDELRLTGSEEDGRTLTAKGDYVRPLGAQGRVEAGVRGSWKTSSEMSLTEVFGPLPGQDPREALRYAFDWRENEQAAYVNLSRTFGRLSLQAGLRAEAADVGLSRGAEALVDADYFSIFPSSNLSLRLGEGRDLRISYSKRVRRPWTWALNPYVPQTDPLNLRYGNPDLKPTETHSFGLDASARIKVLTLRLSPYFRRTTDELEYIRTVDSAGVATTIPRNIATVTSYGSTLNASVRPAAWSTLSATVGASRTERDASNLASAYSGTGTTRFFSANASLQPGKGFGLQGSVRLSSPRETSQGRYSSTLWSELGIRKSLLNEKASVNVRLTDPFNIFHTTFESRDPSFAGTSRSTSSWAARTASVSFTWRFGNTPKRRSTGGEGGTPGGPPTGGGPP